jgi:hypothetical protein
MIAHCLSIISFIILLQLAYGQDYHPRHFIVHSEPDCSDYGQVDTVGEDFMHVPQYWVNNPLDACFVIQEEDEGHHLQNLLSEI